MTAPFPVTESPRSASAAPAATTAPGSAVPAGPTVLRMGLDIGSTTIKLVLLPEHLPGAPAGAQSASVAPVFAEYRRHI